MQGELFSEVVDNGGLAEARARTFFRQVLLGMAYCHRRKLVHRDIKLENLLLTGDRTHPLLKPQLGPLEAAQLNSLECPTSLRHWRCLVSGSTCKIADFGLAKDVAQDEASTILGTIKYMAPEMFAGAMYDGSKSDIWAAGVCLYCMTECRFPFTPPEGGNGGAGGIDVHKVRARSLPAVQC